MPRIISFFKKHQTTAWMLVFLLFFYGSFFLSALLGKKETPAQQGSSVSRRMSSEEFKLKEALFCKNMEARPELLMAFSAGFLGLLGAGLGLDAYFIGRKLKGEACIQKTLDQAGAPWGWTEVVQVLVLLFFVEAWVILLEAGAEFLFHVKFSGKDFTLMTNSLFRDVIVAGFVVFLVTKRFRKPLADLGLTTRHLLRDIWEGIVAYLAMIPLLLGLLFILSLIARAFSFEPPPQPVVEIYLKEARQNYLVYFTLFVAVVGPVIEEIFFRGFAYKAFRTQWGTRWAMATSAFIFAALHMSWIAFLPIFVLGLFLAYLYEKSGSLVPSMTAHMLHNLMMVSLTLGFKEMSG